MFIFQIVAIWFPTLKHLLVSPFVLLLLWTSHMSNQMIAISVLGNILMIQGFEATTMLLKIWLSLIIILTMFAEIEALVFFKR